jgi:hypothetical protein
MSDKTVRVIIFSRDIDKDELVDVLLLVTTVVGPDIASSGVLIFRRLVDQFSHRGARAIASTIVNIVTILGLIHIISDLLGRSDWCGIVAKWHLGLTQVILVLLGRSHRCGTWA